jgi:hypothetical protein
LSVGELQLAVAAKNRREVTWAGFLGELGLAEPSLGPVSLPDIPDFAKFRLG